MFDIASIDKNFFTSNAIDESDIAFTMQKMIYFPFTVCFMKTDATAAFPKSLG